MRKISWWILLQKKCSSSQEKTPFEYFNIGKLPKTKRIKCDKRNRNIFIKQPKKIYKRKAKRVIVRIVWSLKMSSQDQDIDINVVSSPEHSPQPDYGSARIKYQPASTPTSNSTTMSNRVSINQTTSDSSDMSPAAKTPPHDNGKNSSGNSGYTSFTISNILSRNDPKKDSLAAAAANLPFVDAAGGVVHDAAMLSR